MDENKGGPRTRLQALGTIRDILRKIAAIVRIENRGVFGPTVYRFYGPRRGPKKLPAFRRASITDGEHPKLSATRRLRRKKPPKV